MLWPVLPMAILPVYIKQAGGAQQTLLWKAGTYHQHEHTETAYRIDSMIVSPVPSPEYTCILVGGLLLVSVGQRAAKGDESWKRRKATKPCEAYKSVPPQLCDSDTCMHEALENRRIIGLGSLWAKSCIWGIFDWRQKFCAHPDLLRCPILLGNDNMLQQR